AAAVALARPASALPRAQRALDAFHKVIGTGDEAQLPNGLSQGDLLHAQTLLLALQGYAREAERLLLRIEHPTSAPTAADLSRVLVPHQDGQPHVGELVNRGQKRGSA